MVGLLCVRPAMEGGVSTIVSAAAVYSSGAAAAARPRRRARRHRGGGIGARPTSTPSFFQRRIFAVDDDGRFAGYYGRSHIESGRARAPVPELDARQIEAARPARRLANDPARFVLNMHFRPGDVQFLNNYKIWHARTSYVDYPSPSASATSTACWLHAARADWTSPDDFRHGGITDREVAFG